MQLTHVAVWAHSVKINICRVHKCIAKTVRRFVMNEAKDLIWRILLAQRELAEPVTMQATK
jgi:hypothetical protein